MKFVKILICIALITLSCRKDMPNINRPNDYLINNFTSVFESFWTGMNNNYIFWDIDPTDWDAIYDTYRPKFVELDINAPDDIKTAVKYFKEITKDLVDGHYILLINEIYSDLLGRDRLISPSAERHRNRNYEQQKNDLSNFIFRDLQGRLNNPLRGVAHIAGDNTPLRMLQGRVNNTAGKNICYFYFNRFAITPYLESIANGKNIDDNEFTPIHKILETLFSALSDPQLDGVIIDMRGNEGGFESDLNILWASFLAGQDVLAGTLRKKMGEGRLDYGQRTPYTLKPAEKLRHLSALKIPTNPKPVTAPIVILADLNSISCAEISTVALSNLPNGYFVGETTWGGQGVLMDNDQAITIFNGGTFNNIFFDLVYTPFAKFECVNGNNYEGKGYSPNDAPRGYEVKYNAAAIAAGNDPQFEKALEIIINK